MNMNTKLTVELNFSKQFIIAKIRFVYSTLLFLVLLLASYFSGRNASCTVLCKWWFIYMELDRMLCSLKSWWIVQEGHYLPGILNRNHWGRHNLIKYGTFLQKPDCCSADARWICQSALCFFRLHAGNIDFQWHGKGTNNRQKWCQELMWNPL